MDAFRVRAEDKRELSIYPKGDILADKVYVGVSGKPDWEGYHSIEHVGLTDEQVDALHEWLGKIIEERE